MSWNPRRKRQPPPPSQRLPVSQPRPLPRGQHKIWPWHNMRHSQSAVTHHVSMGQLYPHPTPPQQKTCASSLWPWKVLVSQSED